jgi:hypothetical protein
MQEYKLPLKMAFCDANLILNLDNLKQNKTKRLIFTRNFFNLIQDLIEK